jgi:hypothetical protein
MRLKIRIMKGAKETYAWWGHKYSTFRVVGDRLYFVSFDIVSPGGTVLAVDLLTGKTLWQSELPPAGYPGHSFYRNRVILNADEETVSIYGNETGGRYFELKSAKTGKSLGRKTFDPAVDVKVSKP